MRPAVRDVRLAEAWARRLLAADPGGGRPSHSRGQGLDFDDLRAYVPGDDVRAIDWNVTARTREPHVRQYREDREASLAVWVDTGLTMDFGSPVPKKRRAAEVAATLTLLAAASGGSVGLVGGPSRAGMTHARCVAERLYSGPVPPATGRATPRRAGRSADQAASDRADGYDTLRQLVGRRRRTCCLLTDYFQPLPESLLATLSRRHRVLVLCVYDPVERSLPAGAGLIRAVDPLTGRRCELDTDSRQFRTAFADAAEGRRSDRRRRVRAAGAAFAEASTGEPTPRVVARLVRGWR